jgi:hypothetical protein
MLCPVGLLSPSHILPMLALLVHLLFVIIFFFVILILFVFGLRG